MRRISTPIAIFLGLLAGVALALVVLGMAPDLGAKRAMVDAAGPFALAATGAALLALVTRPAGSSSPSAARRRS